MSRADYSSAYVQTAQNASPREMLAGKVLREEIFRRTWLALGHADETGGQRPVIRLYTDNSLKKAGEYAICVQGGRCTVRGHDDISLLYGVGKLLRVSYWGDNRFLLPDGYEIQTAPEKEIRGVQLGYHSTSNACEAWSFETYEQYIRELCLFGANCIEIMPPTEDPKNLLVRYDPWIMTRRISEIARAYGLRVWMWYANGFDDDAGDDVIEKEKERRERVFREIPYLDHIFIPGGDPGKLSPARLFSWAKTVHGIASKHHPDIGMWLSPQTGTPSAAWRDSFYAEVAKLPEWLTGIVFGPWERDNIPQLRKQIPDRYPIRNYPDIAHTLRCQYPVPEWDLSMALTLGRECVNPRPRDEKHIHNLYKDYNIGSLSYSEGINDDFNKFIWLDQEWNSDTDARQTTLEYSSLFIDCALKDRLTEGFYLLEDNLRGCITENAAVEKTYALWTSLESELCPFARDNYRFELPLIRAMFDKYQKNRRRHEAVLENEAISVLKSACENSVDDCIAKAEAILGKAVSGRQDCDLAGRINAIADRLFLHIGAQLTQTRHLASNWDRGAFVECLNIPLNDSRYINKCLSQTKIAETSAQKLMIIDALINRTNPYDGGFYDDCGAPESRSRFENYGNFESDPGFFETPLTSYLMPSPFEEKDTDRVPLAWRRNVSALYQTPLVMNYEGLDPKSEYTIRTVYAKYHIVHISLNAGENACIPVHGEIAVDMPFAEVENALPKEAYRDGKLRLSFTVRDGERGPNVSEVLIRKKR